MFTMTPREVAQDKAAALAKLMDYEKEQEELAEQALSTRIDSVNYLEPK